MPSYKGMKYRKKTPAVFRRPRRMAPIRSRLRRKGYSFKADVHFFKRYAADTTIVGNAVYNPYLAVQAFQFSDIINPTEFTTLFDHYKITKVVTKFWLKIDPSAQAAASASYPKLYWARDTDDSTVPSTLNELRQFNTMKLKVMNPNRPITIVTKPNILGLSYSTAIVSTYTPKWNQWIDCADTATRYFGFKYGIDDLTNTNYRVNIESVYYFQCKNTR